MYNKPVETYVGTADKAVTDKPTLVYWIAIEINTPGTMSLLRIRDGFSTSAPVVARLYFAYGRVHSFYPPIRCAHGLYVDIEATVISYTIGYREEKDIPSLK